ncbi:MAG: UDP-N-acetylmuramoyl-L-alanine--D-glutamate ligase [Alphaproteobacteria bacterium]|nr:UDP-N-acetylmuramoyl-L-alanine--D-glutamate ligase [Alphaproteobacteria bacterium]
MIEIQSRREQKIALFGLGASGLATAHALSASGANVLAWDDNDDQRSAAQNDSISLCDLNAQDFTELDALILAPGVPLTHKPHPIAQKAKAANCPILGDIELLIESCPTTQFIGITGTNGKSTTTALIGHMLATAGIKSQIGGNLGPPALGFEMPAKDEVIVLELSSYQLDLTQDATFDIAVFLNVSADHLDRHGDMDGYIKAKRRIFRDKVNPIGPQIAIIGVDDDNGRSLHQEFSQRSGWKAIAIAMSDTLDDGFYANNGILYEAIAGNSKAICDLSHSNNLPGDHNWQNAAAAAAVGHVLELSGNKIAQAIKSYPGLPHRTENLGSIKGVTFVNDSKATNGEAAARALACYKNIFWIAGGRAKDNGLAVIRPFLPNIQHTFLIGEAGPAFEAELAGAVPVTQCEDLKTATKEAFRVAIDHGTNPKTVLLSPACASFDQWKNFEARGDAFKSFVTDLAEVNQ